jgi:hypothetical protein
MGNQKQWEEMNTTKPTTIIPNPPTAFHVHLLQEHCYKKQKCIDRTQYISTTLIKDLHVRQKQLMEEELGVPFLDLFEATYLLAS